MGQRREILERLEALERRSGRRDDHGCDHHHHGGHHHHQDQDGENDFDEKRVIDTIVRLVTEQVGKLLDKQQSGERDRNEGYDEKRIVDLIVGCVSEHVQEIVATELDRRLGRPDAKGANEERPSKPVRPRGGSSEPEPA